MKVLIGVDGSAGGVEAVRQAGRLLGPQDEVALYFSLNDMRLPGRVEPEMVERARLAVAETIFDEARKQLPESLRDKSTTIVGQRKPAEGLITAIDEWRAELAVVGARGHSKLTELLIGSVAREVVHAAGIPVLVARAPDPAPSVGPRVLVACDGSGTTQDACDFLGRFSWPATTQGHVMQVIESMFAGEIPEWLAQKARDTDTEAMAQAWISGHDQERAATLAALRKLQACLPASFQSSEPLVAEGSPAEEILRVAKSQSTDLIVMGARGLGRWSRMLVGSVSEKILSHAPCSVLIVRKHRST
jgi:nucleotide-binding universal stress UspA family protein